MNYDMVLRSGARKKTSLKKVSKKIIKKPKVNFSPYRDPTHITFDSYSDQSMSIEQGDEAWGVTVSDDLPRETPNSMRSFNSPYPWGSTQANDGDIRTIIGLPPIAPPASRETSVLLESIRTIPTTLTNAHGPPRTNINLLPATTAVEAITTSTPTTTTSHPPVRTVNSTFSQQYIMPRASLPMMQPQLTTNPYLNAALGINNNNSSRTDKLLEELIRKFDDGFSSLNTNIRANVQGVPRAPTQTSYQPVNNANAVPPPPVTNASENDSIARLERVVSGLANQVQTLTQRIDTSSTIPNTASIPERENSQNFYQNSSQHRYRIWPNKWKIRYDGDNSKLAIEFFLHQVSILKESNDVMWEQVITSFPQFLEGDASKWFYRYHRNQPNPLTWEQLKQDMIAQFKGVDCEESLWCKLANRRQGTGETFDKYYNCLLDLQDRVDRRFSDEEMIGILRQNIKNDLKKCLVTFTPPNLAEFVKKCRQTDQLLYPHLYSDHVPYNRRVAEIENHSNVEEGLPTVEAFSPRRPQNAKFLSNVKCWNCDQIGHVWDMCEEARNLFCYYCGHKNVTCRTCPACSTNFRYVTRPDDPPPATSTESEQFH